MRMNESLVEVSPSTEMQLKERCAAYAIAFCNRDKLIRASVATKPSIVAISGWIMPAPLAMPVIVMLASPILMRDEAALGSVSVVMIACAALYQLSVRKSAMQAGSPAAIRSAGNGSMI